MLVGVTVAAEHLELVRPFVASVFIGEVMDIEQDFAATAAFTAMFGVAESVPALLSPFGSLEVLLVRHRGELEHAFWSGSPEL